MIYKNRSYQQLLSRLLIAACVIFTTPNIHAATKNDFFDDAVVKLEELDFASAVIQLKNSLQLDPEFIAAWLKLADTYLATAHGGSAEIAVVKAQQLGADPNLTFVRLANAYLIQAKTEELLALKAPRELSDKEHAELLIIQGKALLELHRLKPASEKFNQAARLDPANPDHLLGNSMVLLHSGDTQEALTVVEKALALDSLNAESWYVKAEINRNLGYPEEALKYFTRAVSLQELHLPARIGRATIYLNRGNYKKAKQELDVVIEHDASNLQALFLNGLAHSHLELPDKANEYLDRATKLIGDLSTEISSNHLPSQFISAILHIREGNYQSAVAPLENFIRQQPAHWGARRLLAQCYLNLRYTTRAKKILLNMAVEQPQDPSVQWLLGEMYTQLNDGKRAERAFREAQNLGFDSKNINTRIGAAMIANGNISGALEAFEAESLLDPSNPKPKLAQYNLFLAQSQPLKALEVANSLLEQEPENARYHNLVGAVKLILGNRQQAREHFTVATSTDPDFLTPHINLAEMLRQEGHLEDATERYQKLRETFGLELEIARGLAEIELQKKHPQQALEWLEKIRSIDASAIGDRLTLVKTYILVNNIDGAVNELRELRNENPLNLDIVLSQANLAHVTRNITATEDHLAQATAMALGDPKALSKVIAMQRQVGFYAAAIKNLNRLRALTQNHQFIDINIARMNIKLGDYDRAIAISDKLSEEFPDFDTPLIIKGQALYSAGRYAEAILVFEEVVSRTGGQIGGVDLARSYWASGNRHQALALLEERFQSRPNEINTGLILAEYLTATNQYQVARERLDKIIAADPDNFAAINNLAVILAQMKDPQAAIVAERALSLKPESPAALDTLGWILLENNRPQEAINYLREAYSRNASEPEIKFHLASALIALQVDLNEAEILLEDLAQHENTSINARARNLLSDLKDLR